MVAFPNHKVIVTYTCLLFTYRFYSAPNLRLSEIGRRRHLHFVGAIGDRIFQNPRMGNPFGCLMSPRLIGYADVDRMACPIMLTSNRLLDAPYSAYAHHSYFRRFLKFTSNDFAPFVENADVIAFAIAMSPGRYRPSCLREALRSEYGIHVKVFRNLSRRDGLDIYGSINMTPRRNRRMCRNSRCFLLLCLFKEGEYLRAAALRSIRTNASGFGDPPPGVRIPVAVFPHDWAPSANVSPKLDFCAHCSIRLAPYEPRTKK